MDEAELQEQCKAAGIDLIRAELVKGHYLKGGPLRISAIGHLTPLMLRFMASQGGPLADFARDIEIVGVSAGSTDSDGFVVPKKHVDEAVNLAALLTEGHDRKHVDPFADQLVKCFGDTHSREYFCGIGHALLAGELRQHEFRDALVRSLEIKTQVLNRVRLFTARIQRMRRPPAMRRHAEAPRFLRTA